MEGRVTWWDTLDFSLAAGLSGQYARARCSDHEGHRVLRKSFRRQNHKLNEFHLSGTCKSWWTDLLDVWQWRIFGMHVTCVCFTYKEREKQEGDEEQVWKGKKKKKQPRTRSSDINSHKPLQLQRIKLHTLYSSILLAMRRAQQRCSPAVGLLVCSPTIEHRAFGGISKARSPMKSSPRTQAW